MPAVICVSDLQACPLRVVPPRYKHTHWHTMLTPRHITVNTTNAFSSSNNSIPHIQLCSMCKYLPCEIEIWGARYVAETKACKSRWTVKEQTTQPCFCCFCKHYKRLFCTKKCRKDRVPQLSASGGSRIQPSEVSADRDSWSWRVGAECAEFRCSNSAKQRLFSEALGCVWLGLRVYWGIMGNATENKKTHAALVPRAGVGTAVTCFPSVASRHSVSLGLMCFINFMNVVFIRKPHFI